MGERKKISAEVDRDILEHAMELVGEGSISETVRVGLMMIVDHTVSAAVESFEVAASVVTVAVPELPPQLASEMSEADVAAWKKAFSDARLSLVKAKAKLAGRKASLDTSTAEKQVLTIKIADVQAEITKIRARGVAFEKSQVTMPSPTEPTLDAIRVLIAKVGEKAADAAKADAIVAASVELAKALGAV